ncbi:MAG: type IX secretion system membrane protein PorP/SprF [Flavobacteriaceae bacterium]|nr:type IX secretion system membrane protein PorP/SprF [Flavobacteriaceae bacterium]
MRLTFGVFLFCFFLIGQRSRAQEGIPIYFDYLSDNYYLIHPSMAGASYGTKVRLTARKQWFDVEKAPSMQTLNAHTRLGEQSAIGGIFFNDRNGYHSQAGLKLTYAHHLPLSGEERYLNQFSFGMSGTFIQSTLDETDFVSVIPDPAINGGRNSASYYNIDLGFSYHYLEFYAHATILNLLSSKRNIYYKDRNDDPNLAVIDNLRRYLVSVGYVFDQQTWQIEPSILFQMTDFTKEKSLDFNAKAYTDVSFGKFWGGVSYRRSFGGAQYNSNGTVQSQKLQLITPILGINFKNWMFAYTYSYQIGDVRFDNGGFHQLTIGYDFGQREKRYDCNCPAVNF